MHSKIICIGSVLIDELFFCEEPVMKGTSNPASMHRNIGGVISNIAMNLHHLGCQTSIITVIGNDADASWITDKFNSIGIDLSGTIHTTGSTGRFSAILQPDGALYTAACMDPVGAQLTVSLLSSNVQQLIDADLIVIDTNPQTEVIQWVIDFCRQHNKKLIIETVSVAKAKKLATMNLDAVYLITPNEDELLSMHKDAINESDIISELLINGVLNIWVKKGSRGSVFYNADGVNTFSALQVEVKDTTGAGDSALAAWIAGYCRGLSLEDCVNLGHHMAAEMLKINGTVNDQISFDQLMKFKQQHDNQS
jgi:pseudouridine kinase